MSYLDTLTTEQRNNIAIITDDARKAGITNDFAIAGILAIISKESSFVPKQEKPYSGTANSRIRKVFGSRVPSSDSALNTLKASPQAFFDAVYGSRNGNASNEGYKYRGRGLNQITFKGNYKKFADLSNTDIVNNPDKMLDINTASKVAIQFAKDGINKLKQSGKLQEYNANDINDFKNSKDATLAFYHANAGTGKSTNYIKDLAANDPYGGMTRALERVSDLVIATKSFVKKKPLLTISVTAVMILSVWALIKYSGIGKTNKVINTIVN
tara:strand:- start:2145 stop:2954 length:810 start_codon:yes stop_codon:yes gene_type:complete